MLLDKEAIKTIKNNLFKDKAFYIHLQKVKNTPLNLYSFLIFSEPCLKSNVIEFKNEIKNNETQSVEIDLNAKTLSFGFFNTHGQNSEVDFSTLIKQMEASLMLPFTECYQFNTLQGKKDALKNISKEHLFEKYKDLNAYLIY